MAKVIKKTGTDPSDENINRYREMMKANEGKSWEERRDAINAFRCGY